MAWWVLSLRIAGLGWYVAFCIVIGVVGGVWLDNRLNTLPIFTLVGVVMGSVAAFYGVYKLVQPLFGETDRGHNRPKRGPE